jgi:molybdopterin synthase catalytic subunit
MIKIVVGPDDFDAGAELDRLRLDGVGGIASFVGIVRGGAGLVSMTLDHYPAMTQRALHLLAEQAMAQWGLEGVTIAHRVGTLVPGDRIVFVGTAAAHRKAALEGCEFMIDALKMRAPFWKNETFDDGRSVWVEARASDDQAAARWV